MKNKTVPFAVRLSELALERREEEAILFRSVAGEFHGGGPGGGPGGSRSPQSFRGGFYRQRLARHPLSIARVRLRPLLWLS